jgi:hypothetical protein
MCYVVLWDDTAADELQRIHDDVLDKEGLVHAVVRIGMELRQLPLEAGESRGGNRQVLLRFPLIDWFGVNDRLRTVRDIKVALSRR